LFRKATLPLCCSLLLLLSSCTQPQLPDYPPAYREYAYVTNGKSNDVTVINLLNFKTARTISVGNGPTGVMANPKKNEVYVVNTDSNNLSIIDAEQNSVVATIGLHRMPFFVDLTPDGRRAVVANSGSANLSIIDLDKRAVITNIAVGARPGLARVSPDGKLALVSNRGDNTLSVVDLARLAVRSTVAICKSPEEIAVLPDSSKAFITCSGSNQVAVVALGAEPVAEAQGPPAKGAQRPVAGRGENRPVADRLLALLDVGKTPLHIVLRPEGWNGFVSNFDSDSISTVTTATNEVSNTHVVGPGPVRSIVSADSSLLYVSNFKGDSVAVYNVEAEKPVTSVRVGRGPDAMAFTPDQHYLLVVDSGSGDVAVIRNDLSINAHILFTMVPVGLGPRQIAVKAFMLRTLLRTAARGVADEQDQSRARASLSPLNRRTNYRRRFLYRAMPMAASISSLARAAISPRVLIPPATMIG